MIYDAPVRLGTTEVYIRTRLRSSCIHFKNSETFTPTENVLTTCAKTIADPELGRTREGGGRQRYNHDLDASKSAQQTAEEEKDMRRYWVRPLLEGRPLLGQYERLMAELREEDVSTFRKFVRMDQEMFRELLLRLSPSLT